MTRLLLFTGKGGVGKSTVAAGTAALAAERGRRTLLVSTDPAHSLTDALGAQVGPEPTAVAPGLFAQQVDAQARLEEAWGEARRYLLDALGTAGVDPLTAEELTVVPGAEEVLALLEVRRHALGDADGGAGDGGEPAWDLVVVDCAPTGETLRLLALPEVLGWYLERLLPTQRRMLRALRPLLDRGTGLPVPGADVVATLARLHRELGEVRALLSGPEAGVRVVLTPESVVLAEARRAWTALSLYGYRVDGVVANRVFPAGTDDPWRAGWVRSQAAVLDEVADSFAGLPVWRAEYRADEPVGLPALTALAHDLYGDDDPLAAPAGPGPFRVTRTSTGPVLHLALPLARRGDVDLARTGDELVITLRGHQESGARSMGSWRRLLTLPPGLARLRVAGAAVTDGELRVRFRAPEEPDEPDDPDDTHRPERQDR